MLGKSGPLDSSVGDHGISPPCSAARQRAELSQGSSASPLRAHEETSVSYILLRFLGVSGWGDGNLVSVVPSWLEAELSLLILNMERNDSWSHTHHTPRRVTGSFERTLSLFGEDRKPAMGKETELRCLSGHG